MLKIFLGCVVLLSDLIYLGISSQRMLENNLPPKEVFATIEEAGKAAQAFAQSTGGSLGSVFGTGSMVPFIPSAKPGESPTSTIVAFVVSRPGATFADIRVGDLCTYQPADRTPGQTWIHLAAKKDSAGWIMTGLNNKHYENWMRVTPANFSFIVSKVFTIQ